MKKVNKRSMLSLLLIPMLLLSMMAIAPATTNAAEDLGLTVDAAILITAGLTDAEYGQIDRKTEVLRA